MTTTHRVYTDSYAAAEANLLNLSDPGDGRAIKLFGLNNGHVSLLIAAAGETRTLPDTTTLGPGICVTVVANQITGSGDCTIEGTVLDAEGEFIKFETMLVNGAVAWKLVGTNIIDPANDTSFDYLDGDHTISETIVIAGTPEWSGDQHYSRTPIAGHLHGQSMSAHLIAAPGLTGAMIETEDYGVQGAYRASIRDLWLDGAQSMTVSPWSWTLKSISSSTNASPIVITATSHGFSNGQTVRIEGHATNTAANGDWVIGSVTTHTFTLVGSTGNGVGSSTGVAHVISADVCDGVHLDGNDCDIRDLFIEGFKGIGLKIIGGTNDANPATSGVVTFPLNRTSYVKVCRCHQGIVDTDTDSWIDHCGCDYIQGNGLTVSGGNQKVTNSHFYGCQQAAVKSTAEGNQFLSVDASDSQTGFDIQAAHNRIDSCYMQGNFGEGASGVGGFASIYVGAAYTVISNCVIKLRDAGNSGSSGLYKKGVDFYYHTSSMIGGMIYQTAAYTMGIDVRNYAVSVIGTVLEGGSAANQTGLNINSANIHGQTFDVDCSGYTGSSSEAVNIANWGSGNVLRVTQWGPGGGVAVRASAGWATGGGATSRNAIYIDGVPADASDQGGGVYGAALP